MEAGTWIYWRIRGNVTWSRGYVLDVPADGLVTIGHGKWDVRPDTLSENGIDWRVATKQEDR